MTLLYFSLFAIGVIFTIATSLLSLGNGHVDHGADGSGHVEVPVFSPTILSAFITGFGGVGAILRISAQLPLLLEISLAAAGGLVLAGIGLLILGAITRQTQVGSEYATAELVGAHAEVITPIPVGGGLGEIAYIKKGTRSNAPARSASGQPIPRNADVRIIAVSGTSLVVEPLSPRPQST